ncbi:hypothetical protein P171DRAFT_430575 [Karstenula rhodostoma CBS 690.94]|uniref:DUF6536 domain-containing protein n=1 Tax=Karstenula rhodostoma CBS 690.94 TaxID=1392251 RepID=A0A9P4PP88_9PLEO|nr:hypothetical protein P171DRAFT_430575 [Karstenula rhodostoma CBS 690.94]
MSSAEIEITTHGRRPPPRPPTPGVVSDHAGVSLHQQSGYSSLRSSSLDLIPLSSRQEAWTELESYPTNATCETDSDARHLLGNELNSTSSKTKSLVQTCTGPFRRLHARLSSYNTSTRYHGWRMGVLFGSCISALILCFNIAVLIVASTKGSGFQNGFAEPFSYDSRNVSRLSVSRLSSAIHIVINVLSTLLLSASNYTMQVLSSPTRAEIDREHRRGNWFDIGVLSVHNFKRNRISWRRKSLCAILVLSSVPLHLFYNSSAIYAAETNKFNVSLVSYDTTDASSLSRTSNFTRFPNGRWQAEYMSSTVNFGDLTLIVDDFASHLNFSNPGNPFLNKSGLPTEFKLPEKTDVSLNDIVLNLTSWINITNVARFDAPYSINGSVYAHVIEGYGKNVPTKSRIQLSQSFLIIVIVCNAVKLTTMLWVLYMEKNDFIVTLGDGIASFLEHRDPTTEKFCVFSKEAITAEVAHRMSKQEAFRTSFSDPSTSNTQSESAPKVKTATKTDYLGEMVLNSSGMWRDQNHLYSSALGKDRQVGSSFIFGVILSSLILCFVLFVYLAQGYLDHAWGTSSKTVRTVGDGSGSTLLVAWIANSPQIVLSFCYFAINSECTSMAGAYEWNNLGSSRKGLRVTKPLHQQRDTYFLQLPLRFSLPLMAMSGWFHWLLSQSIFLVQIYAYDREGNLIQSDSISGLGISSISFIVLCVTFFAFVLVVGLVGRKRLRVRIPFAASCSLVVSAACHAPSREQDTHWQQVQWGVVQERMFDGELHCSFSSEPVEEPQVGVQYR